MIVVLTAHDPPQLDDLDRLDRLHAEVHGSLDDARLDPLCARADDDHVWLDVVGARTIGLSVSDDPTFGEQFDAMIAFAAGHGWLDETGTRVRAHVRSPE